jgi:hypothetical protein
VSDAPPASDPVAPIPSAPQARDRLVTPRFMVVTAATFAYFCSLGSMLPTLPRYVRDELGGGGTEVGLVVGAFAVSAALIRPWAGRLGDVRGRRVLVSGGSAVLAASVLGYAAVDSLVPLVALRLVSGIGEAALFVGAATAVQDLAPDDRRGEAASYFSVALYGGLALGPAAGERILSTWGFDAVWYAAAAAGLVAAVLGLFTPTGPAGTGVRPDRLLHGAALGPGLVLLLGLIPFTGFAAFLALYGEQVGVDDVGPVFALYAGTVLVIRIFGARLPDLLGWRRASTLALVRWAPAPPCWRPGPRPARCGWRRWPWPSACRCCSPPSSSPPWRVSRTTSAARRWGPSRCSSTSRRASAPPCSASSWRCRPSAGRSPRPSWWPRAGSSPSARWRPGAPRSPLRRGVTGIPPERR